MVIIPTASENASLALLPSSAAMASFSVCSLVSVKKQAIKISLQQDHADHETLIKVLLKSNAKIK